MVSPSQSQICLSQTQMYLSQTQLRQLACSKSVKIVTNGVPVAPFELKLGQNESYGLQGPFKTPPGLREHISGPKFQKNNNISPNSRSTAPAAAMLPVRLGKCKCCPEESSLPVIMEPPFQ